MERPRNESLDKYVGISRWKLSSDINGDRHDGSANSTCHGKWIGDTRLLMDCRDPRCARSGQTPPYASQLFRRSRRGAVGMAAFSKAEDRASRMTGKIVRRRGRKGGGRKEVRRRGKKSRRRRAVVDARR